MTRMTLHEFDDLLKSEMFFYNMKFHEYFTSDWHAKKKIKARFLLNPLAIIFLPSNLKSIQQF